MVPDTINNLLILQKIIQQQKLNNTTEMYVFIALYHIISSMITQKIITHFYVEKCTSFFSSLFHFTEYRETKMYCQYEDIHEPDKIIYHLQQCMIILGLRKKPSYIHVLRKNTPTLSTKYPNMSKVPV